MRKRLERKQESEREKKREMTSQKETGERGR